MCHVRKREIVDMGRKGNNRIWEVPWRLGFWGMEISTVGGGQWTGEQIREDRMRSTLQSCVKVWRQQRVEVAGTQFSVWIKKVKVQTTRAERKKKYRTVGILCLAMLEFHVKVIEVILAEYVIWSKCMAFSRAAWITKQTICIRLKQV